MLGEPGDLSSTLSRRRHQRPPTYLCLLLSLGCFLPSYRHRTYRTYLPPSVRSAFTMPERSTGPMMFIGERCALDECHREDFLPFKCGDCRQHFCSDHFRPQSHRCSNYHDTDLDYRVPLCPICDNPPEGWKRDQDPNIAMDRHLSGQCPMLDSNGYLKSGAPAPASNPMKRAKKTNECSFVKCSKIMVVPIQCPQCSASFCPSHRAPNQHSCNHSSSSSSSASRVAASTPSNGGIRNAFQNLKISTPNTSSAARPVAPANGTANQSNSSSSTSAPFSKMFDKSEKWVPKPIFGKA